MSKRPGRLSVLGLAFIILAAAECDLGEFEDILQKPGTITVTNIGDETAVVAILADDVKSYPTLSGGAKASVTTNVGGRYQVRVVMSPESMQRYQQDLLALRRIVEHLIDGAATAEEKTRLFLTLAAIKAALQTGPDAAGCAGSIALDTDADASVSATLAWVRQSGTGFWDATCGSN